MWEIMKLKRQQQVDFDEISREWDNERRIKRAKIISNKIKKNITNLKDKLAMEFGCGTGLVSFNLVNEFKNITLIDNSQGMIDIVNEKIEKLDHRHINGKCIDLAKGSLNEKYDIIYTSMALHHVIEIDELINKFYNMLNKNGILCIVDLDEENGSFHKNEKGFNGHNGFSQNWLKNILIKNSFNNIKAETFYKDIKKIDIEEVPYSLFIITANK